MTQVGERDVLSGFQDSTTFAPYDTTRARFIPLRSALPPIIPARSNPNETDDKKVNPVTVVLKLLGSRCWGVQRNLESVSALRTSGNISY